MDGMDGIEESGYGFDPGVEVAASVYTEGEDIPHVMPGGIIISMATIQKFIPYEETGVLEEIELYIHVFPARLHAAFKSLIEAARNHV